MSRRWKNLLFAVVVLVGSAFMRAPLEQSLTQDLRSQRLLPEKLDLSVREQVSQESFAAALGGMRSLLACIYELQAFSAWIPRHGQPANWAKVDQYYAICTLLQPHDPHYWEFHSWMLAANAAADYRYAGLASPGQEKQLQQFYRRKGIELAEKGLKNCPDSYILYRHLAHTLANPHPDVNPNPDYEKAADYYLAASKLPKAPRYLYRLYAITLAKVPSRAQEAYTALCELYRNGGQDRQPSVQTHLRLLEKALNIPPEQRLVKDAQDAPPSPPAPRQSSP